MKAILLITTILISAGCTPKTVPPEFFDDIKNTLHEPEKLPEWEEGKLCGEVLLEVQNKYQRCAIQSESAEEKIERLERAF